MSKQILIDAVKILEENGWSVGKMALDSNGFSISPFHPEAKCFCAIGAIARAAGQDLILDGWSKDETTKNIYDAVSLLEGPQVLAGLINEHGLRISSAYVIFNYNDDVAMSKKKVIEKMKEAIELL